MYLHLCGDHPQTFFSKNLTQHLLDGSGLFTMGLYVLHANVDFTVCLVLAIGLCLVWLLMCGRSPGEQVFLQYADDNGFSRGARDLRAWLHVARHPASVVFVLSSILHWADFCQSRILECFNSPIGYSSAGFFGLDIGWQDKQVIRSCVIDEQQGCRMSSEHRHWQYELDSASSDSFMAHTALQIARSALHGDCFQFGVLARALTCGLSTNGQLCASGSFSIFSTWLSKHLSQVAMGQGRVLDRLPLVT